MQNNVRVKSGEFGNEQGSSHLQTVALSHFSYGHFSHLPIMRCVCEKDFFCLYYLFSSPPRSSEMIREDLRRAREEYVR